ncbi:hypothetical protein G3N95_03300 [Paraburkholderia sp. Tr-20389]|nr:hypothetical protein [Paraburkholderia sp. Tr-20389]
MRTIAFPRFRATYVIAACSVALAATGAYQAPGLMQAILVVGANAQLPLERLAAQADAKAPVADATVSSTAWKEHVAPQARPAVQKRDESGQSMRNRHGRHETHGYERGVTDYKYWT